jgi:hypothetical protein
MASETGTTAGLLSKEQYDLFNNKQSPMQPGIGIQFSGQQGAGGVATFVINATDATITDKGIITLAGDLTGDADLPRINTVGGVLSSTITTVASSVLSATDNNTASTIVKRDGNGGFAAGAVTSSTVNTGTLTATSVVTNTLKVTGGSYTATGAVLTTDGTGNAIWQSASGGITGVGTVTTTSYPNGATISENNLVLAAASSSTPGVLTTQTQTIAGDKTFSGALSSTSLVLTGNLTGTSASFSKAVTGANAFGTSSRTIDFSNSNLAYSTATNTGNTIEFTLNGLKNGGTYTLAWQNTTAGTTAVFTATGFSNQNIKSLGNYPVVATKHAIYTFVVMGTTIYYSMISEQ